MNRLTLLAAVFVLVPFGLAGAVASAQTVVVPGDLQGWQIGPFGTPPAAGFELGAATPPSGIGSYRTEITVPASKQLLIRNDYHDLPLSGLTAFSFWTFIDPATSNTNNWYVNLYLDADGNGTYDTRLDFVPPVAVVAQGVWQQWDALSGSWAVGGAGTTTLADFLASNPNARFNAFNDPNGGAVRFNIGDTASTYVGFAGNLDLVRIAHGGLGDVTWDFEPTLPILDLAPLVSDLPEGDAGTTTFTFEVGRSGETGVPSSASWSVAGVTASPADDADFAGGVLPSGTVSFAVGETSQTIAVDVAGDLLVESDEFFAVTLSTPTAATLGTDTADGIIRNDDAAEVIPTADVVGLLLLMVLLAAIGSRLLRAG